MICFIEKKNQLGGLSQISFTFMLHVFILFFLLRMFFKTVGEPLLLLTVHTKLIFRGAQRKALMVSEDRSYQTQYFAKISPSPLALTLQMNFYLHFQESAENALWIVRALKSATLSAPEGTPKTTLKIKYLMLFLKNLTKNVEKKLVIIFVLME